MTIQSLRRRNIYRQMKRFLTLTLAASIGSTVLLAWKEEVKDAAKAYQEGREENRQEDRKGRQESGDKTADKAEDGGDKVKYKTK